MDTASSRSRSARGLTAGLTLLPGLLVAPQAMAGPPTFAPSPTPASGPPAWVSEGTGIFGDSTSPYPIFIAVGQGTSCAAAEDAAADALVALVAANLDVVRAVPPPSEPSKDLPTGVPWEVVSHWRDAGGTYFALASLLALELHPWLLADPSLENDVAGSLLRGWKRQLAAHGEVAGAHAGAWPTTAPLRSWLETGSSRRVTRHGGATFYGVGFASGIKNLGLAASTAMNRARAELTKDLEQYSAQLMKTYMERADPKEWETHSEEAVAHEPGGQTWSPRLYGTFIVDVVRDEAGVTYALAALRLDDFLSKATRQAGLDKRAINFILEHRLSTFLDRRDEPY